MLYFSPLICQQFQPSVQLARAKFYNDTKAWVSDLLIAISCLFCPSLPPPRPGDKIASLPGSLRMRRHWKPVRRGLWRCPQLCNNLPVFIRFDFINTWGSGERPVGKEEKNTEMISVETMRLPPPGPGAKCPACGPGHPGGEGARSPEAAGPSRSLRSPHPGAHSVGTKHVPRTGPSSSRSHRHLPRGPRPRGRLHPGSVVWWLRTQTPRTTFWSRLCLLRVR